MKDSERLTHLRVGGSKAGYWTPHKKDELLERLARYEDTGLSPEEIEVFQKSGTGKKMREIAKIIPDDEFQNQLDKFRSTVMECKQDGLGYISIKCQLVDNICEMECDQVLTVGQLMQIFCLARE